MMRLGYVGACVCALVSMATVHAAEVDWGRVESTLGRTASVQPDGVHRFGFPRTDLNVTVDGVPLRAAFALGSWLAFKQTGERTVVMGDLVLLENEVTPVRERLLKGGIEVTALHNHMLRARPMPMYMHVLGSGDAVALAETLHTALMASRTPLAAETHSAAVSSATLDTAMLDDIIGRKGKLNGSVYHFGIPRAETIRMGDLVVPPSMGTGAGINFEPSGAGKAAITGDLPLLAQEVAPVMRALTRNGIEVTALHNHMLTENPRLFFMHFWADADAGTVARGIRTALDLMNLAPK